MVDGAVIPVLKPRIHVRTYSTARPRGSTATSVRAMDVMTPG